MSINMICLPAGDGYREGRHGPQRFHEITEACARAGAGKKEAADQSRKSRGTEPTQGTCICHVCFGFHFHLTVANETDKQLNKKENKTKPNSF